MPYFHLLQKVLYYEHNSSIKFSLLFINNIKNDTIHINYINKEKDMIPIKKLYNKFQNSIAPFIELTRGYTLPTSIAPWFVAAAFASVSQHFYPDVTMKLFTTLLTFIAVACIHLGVNLLDDYIDIKKKLNEGIPLNEINFEKARNKGRLIKNGSYSMNTVKIILFILFGIGILSGAYFTFLYGWIIPAIAFITGILCLLYPYSSKFCLGEVIIGLIFGPLLIMGTYTALTGLYSQKLLILSFAVGLMIVVLLDAHNLMDYEYDKKNGKHTLCTAVGSKKRALYIIAAEIIVAYLILIYLAITNQFSYWILLAIVFTAPLSAKLIVSLNDYNNVKDLKFIPKWYLGPMENWDIIQKERYEYFMYRFYIARNIGFIFCVILALVLFFTVKINYIYI